MLPTPSTSHISPSVYEPAEDSFLLLDTLSSPSETAFLTTRFTTTTAAPLVLELGTGSGIVLAFLTAHANPIFGTPAILTAAVDLNAFACHDAATTVRTAIAAAEQDGAQGARAGCFLAAVHADLAAPWRAGVVEVLVFNPPYVPTAALPAAPTGEEEGCHAQTQGQGLSEFERDSRLLELAYAGGRDGMETTERVLAALPEVLSARGCAYVLLCQQNRPEEVKARVRGLGGAGEWRVETVGRSGKVGGWEKLQVIRIWRDLVTIEGADSSAGA